MSDRFPEYSSRLSQAFLLLKMEQPIVPGISFAIYTLSTRAKKHPRLAL